MDSSVFPPPVSPLGSICVRIRQTSGDLSAVAPPVPIPNTEVKHCSPDGSACIACARVGRCQSYARHLGNKMSGIFLLCCVLGGIAVIGSKFTSRMLFTQIASSPVMQIYLLLHDHQ